jgi:hypothetical protein
MAHADLLTANEKDVSTQYSRKTVIPSIPTRTAMQSGDLDREIIFALLIQ